MATPTQEEDGKLKIKTVSDSPEIRNLSDGHLPSAPTASAAASMAPAVAAAAAAASMAAAAAAGDSASESDDGSATTVRAPL